MSIDKHELPGTTLPFGMERTRIAFLALNPPLQLTPVRARCANRIASWLPTSSSSQRKKPALKLPLFPTGANPAGVDGLPEQNQGARVEFNEK